MDFLPKTANLQGGDTRKTPNLANHGVRWRARPPPTRSLQSLPITAYHGNPSQSFLTKIPYGQFRSYFDYTTHFMSVFMSCSLTQLYTLCAQL